MADDDATRVAYDTVAAAYADLLRDELASKPFDRAVLRVFAERVLDDGGGRVADLGCGPGRVAAHLDALDLDVFGVDLSAAMVAVAQREHPHLTFSTGSMASVDVADGGLAGVVAWYSIIHTPPEEHPDLFVEWARAVRAGGHLLVAFQVGDEHARLEQAYGHAISLDVYRLDPDAVSAQLERAGFAPVARVVTEPVGQERHRQAFLMAQRDA